MNVFGEVRQLMPFSDAKEGPFSQLTYSGGAIMSTMADGVTGNASTLHGAMDTAFNQAPRMDTPFNSDPYTNTSFSDTPRMDTYFNSVPYANTSFSEMPNMGSTLETAPNIDTGLVNQTAEKASGSIPVSASSTSSITKSQPVNISFGSINISGVGKDMSQMADEFIDILHDRLRDANTIRSAGKGALL